LVKANPVVSGISGLIDKVFGGFKASGGPVSAGTSYVVGERGPELFTPNRSGSIIPNGAMGGGGSVINLTVNGAIDPEGTARAIINVLNNSSYRGTLGSGAFA
jgi:phage-related minor tail protein